MPANSSVAELKKPLLVISDSAKLARALELNLQDQWQVVHRPIPAKEPLAASEAVALIIVGASLPTSEPVVMLAQAELTEQIGVTPILIISERNFPVDSTKHIRHLDFPFNLDMLHQVIKTITSEKMAPLLESDGQAPACRGSEVPNEPCP